MRVQSHRRRSSENSLKKITRSALGRTARNESPEGTKMSSKRRGPLLQNAYQTEANMLENSKLKADRVDSIGAVKRRMNYLECSVRLVDALQQNDIQAHFKHQLEAEVSGMKPYSVSSSRTMNDVNDNGSKLNVNPSTTVDSVKQSEEKNGNKHLQAASSPQLKFICPHCQVGFSHEEHMFFHIKIIHRQTFNCKKCFMGFMSSDQLALHMTLEHECESSSENITDTHGAKQQPSGEIKRNKLYCKLCSKGFSSKGEFVKHYIAHNYNVANSSKCQYKSQSENTHTGELNKERTYSDKRISKGNERRPRSRDHCQNKATKFLNPTESKQLSTDISSVYSCTRCSYSTTLKKYFLSHLNSVHNVKQRFPCKSCDKTFSNSGNLKLHNESIHLNIRRFTCSECPSSFHMRATLKRHYESTHLNLKKFKCPECPKTFSQVFNMKQHFVRLHIIDMARKDGNEKPGVSPLLESVKNSEATANLPPDSNKIESSSDCPAEMDNQFSKSDGINEIVEDKNGPLILSQDHKEKEDWKKLIIEEAKEKGLSRTDIDWNDDELICSHCQTHASDVNMLTEHIGTVHDKLNDYTCFDCKKMFTHKRILKAHINSLHKQLRPFICGICGSSYHAKATLATHILGVHMKCTNLTCDVCFTVLTSKENLLHHVNAVHKRLKPYRCTECDQSFCSRQKLTRHVNGVHKKLKPFGCPECPTFFSTAGNRNQHVRSVHQKLRPHKCSFCLWAFCSKASLKQHVNSVHMKLKPHKCDQCPAAFSWKLLLKQHICSVHLQLKLHKCDICKSNYSWKRSLLKHKSLIHGVMEPMD